MLEARGDLTSDYVRITVRQGVCNMPRIGRGEVSNDQRIPIADSLEKN